MSEWELYRACKKGSKLAFQTLYERYAPYLLTTIQRYLGEVERSKDLLHDCFLIIFKKFDFFTYQEEGSLKAWLTRICINESLMWLRKSNRIQTFSIDDNRDSLHEGNPIEDIYTIPEEEDIQPISEEVLLQMIRALPDGYRTVFNLYVFEEKSHREIAELLGINEKSSSSQLSRAKKMLARSIKEWHTQHTSTK
ncbi:RNA polymerase sigma factor [Porphyromonas gingivicanis]|uniref:RNA polymerase sigma factor n=1 Tax=Porphyromonas gingivicanis TaxID=266762 RepID=UPI00047168E2|nr:sigma-70 family RNA polymerase sigma factor [Porphyromonas gingivicanis]